MKPSVEQLRAVLPMAASRLKHQKLAWQQEKLSFETHTPEALNQWLWDICGIRLSTKACPEHDAPLQFFWDIYSGRVTNAVALGPRGGGKTFSLAHLETKKAIDRRIHIFHCGGIEEQANRGYDYIRELAHNPRLSNYVLGEPLIGMTKWRNGSRLEIHSATMKQTSGAHPHLKVGDELEQWAWPVLQQFLGMGTVENAQTVFISTRDKAYGTMQAFLDASEKNNFRIYSWCIWDIKEPCPTCRQSDCGLWDECQGKYKDTDGHRSVKNIADKFLTVDRLTWESQYLCQRPGMQGRCFPELRTELGTRETSNVTLEAIYKPEFSVGWAFDDNIALPRAGIFWQEWSDGTVSVFHEYYEAGRLQEQTVRQMLETSQENGWQHPEISVIPPEAIALRIALHNHEVSTIAPKSYRRKEGTAYLAQLIRSSNGQRRLLIHPDCKNLIRSLNFAHRKEISPGIYSDEPEKHDDDHCFVADSMILTDRGKVPISEVKITDKVFTRTGYHDIFSAGITRDKATVQKVHLSNGVIIEGTIEHPIFVQGLGFIPLGQLKKGDELCSLSSVSSSMERNIDAILSQKEQGIGCTLRLPEGTVICTKPYLKQLMGRYQRAIMSTTKTLTYQIMLWIILHLCQGMNINRFTQSYIPHPSKLWRKCNKQQRHGTQQKLEGNGTGSTGERYLRLFQRWKSIVRNVGQFIMPKERHLAFAIQTVLVHGDEKAASITKNDYARFVAKPLQSINMLQPKRAEAPVLVDYIGETRAASVYNLTVNSLESPEYFCNGILVHNCQDAAMYLAHIKRFNIYE